MIVRSGVQLDKLFDTIEASGFLGAFHHEQRQLFNENLTPLLITQNPSENRGQLSADGSVDPNRNQFGFWLPHGLGSDGGQYAARFSHRLRECKNRFNDVEAAFRKAEGLSQDKVWLESEQAYFFEKYASGEL